MQNWTFLMVFFGREKRVVAGEFEGGTRFEGFDLPGRAAIQSHKRRKGNRCHEMAL